MFDLLLFEFKIKSVMEKFMNYLTGMFRQVLANVVRFVTYLHTRILGLNDSYEFYLSDKELHFYVVAITGVLLIIVLYPLRLIFLSLAGKRLFFHKKFLFLDFAFAYFL